MIQFAEGTRPAEPVPHKHCSSCGKCGLAGHTITERIFRTGKQTIKSVSYRDTFCEECWNNRPEGVYEIPPHEGLVTQAPTWAHHHEDHAELDITAAIALMMESDDAGADITIIIM